MGKYHPLFLVGDVEGRHENCVCKMVDKVATKNVYTVYIYIHINIHMHMHNFLVHPLYRVCSSTWFSGPWRLCFFLVFVATAVFPHESIIFPAMLAAFVADWRSWVSPIFWRFASKWGTFFRAFRSNVSTASPLKRAWKVSKLTWSLFFWK